MAKRLIVLAGPDEGRTFELKEDTFLMGRSRATESHLVDPLVSRVHCQILHENQQHVVVDFDSPGGTFVNGKRIERHVLNNGDLIRIGNTRLQYEDQEKGDTGARPQAPPPPSVTQELPGQLIGHYKAGSLLARGKNSNLFHARDTKRNLPVVLKILHDEYGQTEEQVRRFVEMMKRVMPLRHPNLLKIYGAGKTGPHLWVAEEYVPSESLDAVISRMDVAGMLDWRQVLRITIYIARGLDYAHQKGILHLNVTPQNIMIGREPRLTKLTDLMLAAACQGDPAKPISAANLPSENLAYMPPERTHGPKYPVDARADIYCLGATMYALFTGHAPFKGDTVQELVRKIQTEQPVSLKSHMLGVPEALEIINMQMLAKDPAERYQTARSLLKALETYAASHSLQV
ncbi:MAG: FHA domain-containing serine/threonine-protein kinase [Gemmataceae bacterium]